MGLLRPAFALRQTSLACSSKKALAAGSRRCNEAAEDGSLRTCDCVAGFICWSTSASEPACLGSRPRNHCTGAKPCFLSCSFLRVAHMSMVSAGEAVEPAAQINTVRRAMLRNILLQTSTLPNCQCDSAAACRSWMSCRTRYLWKSTEMFLWSGSMKTIFGMPYGGQQTVRKASDIPDGPFGTTISWQESIARSATVKKHCEQFQQFFLKGFLSWARREHSLILFGSEILHAESQLFGGLVVSSVLHKLGA